jgi:hypothetical protein
VRARFQPPLKHLPPQLENVELRWIAKDMFYTIICQKMSKEEIEKIKPINFWFNVEGQNIN